MVICVVIGCSNRSDRDKEFSYCRIPTVTDHQGKEDLELWKKTHSSSFDSGKVHTQKSQYSTLQTFEFAPGNNKHVCGPNKANLHPSSSKSWDHWMQLIQYFHFDGSKGMWFLKPLPQQKQSIIPSGEAAMNGHWGLMTTPLYVTSRILACLGLCDFKYRSLATFSLLTAES